MRDILDILFPILTFGLFFAGIAAKARKKLSGDTGSAVSHSGLDPESPARREVPPVAARKTAAPEGSIPAPGRPRTSEAVPEEGVRAITSKSHSGQGEAATRNLRALESLSEAEKLIVYSEIMHPKFEEN